MRQAVVTGVYRVSRAGGRSTWAHLGDAVCGKPWLLVCTVCHERVGGRRGRTWVTPYAASRGTCLVKCKAMPATYLHA